MAKQTELMEGGALRGLGSKEIIRAQNQIKLAEVTYARVAVSHAADLTSKETESKQQTCTF